MLIIVKMYNYFIMYIIVSILLIIEKAQTEVIWKGNRGTFRMAHVKETTRKLYNVQNNYFIKLYLI